MSAYCLLRLQKPDWSQVLKFSCLTITEKQSLAGDMVVLRYFVKLERTGRRDKGAEDGQQGQPVRPLAMESRGLHPRELLSIQPERPMSQISRIRGSTIKQLATSRRCPCRLVMLMRRRSF